MQCRSLAHRYVFIGDAYLVFLLTMWATHLNSSSLSRGGPFKRKRQLKGKLLERTFDELMIMKDGRKVRIPLALVDEVRLPRALVEAGDNF